MSRITPDNIKNLEDDEIFVFGSNIAGIHGAGAAKTAFYRFGAKYGKGDGIQGRSYAIPTKDRNIKTLRISMIKPFVDSFLMFALHTPNKVFLVTEVGCGLAGYTPNAIAPLFENARNINNIYLPKSFWDIINEVLIRDI